jgi:hypothetical protein
LDVYESSTADPFSDFSQEGKNWDYNGSSQILKSGDIGSSSYFGRNRHHSGNGNSNSRNGMNKSSNILPSMSGMVMGALASHGTDNNGGSMGMHFEDKRQILLQLQRGEQRSELVLEWLLLEHDSASAGNEGGKAWLEEAQHAFYAQSVRNSRPNEEGTAGGADGSGGGGGGGYDSSSERASSTHAGIGVAFRQLYRVLHEGQHNVLAELMWYRKQLEIVGAAGMPAAFHYKVRSAPLRTLLFYRTSLSLNR